nr:uncharacterized protein LOC100182818 [Ciona intestinalis]|eukprot:XP_018672665.1 uncharacterized protein LOC100182818 [Ciona intestinalis]
MNTLPTWLFITVSTYWLDLSRVDNGEKYRWNFIQRTVESMSFDSFMNLSSATDSAKFFSKTGVYGYPDALWSYEQNTNAQLICQLPLVKDYLHQGCYNFDNDLSNHNHLMVNLHNPTNHSANSNSIGSYSLPQACMAVCYEKFNSSVSALASWKCNCMDSNFNTTKLAAITSLDKSDCSSSFFLAQNQQMSLGYSSLNFPLSSTKDLSYIPGEYCGATEWGGGYKCGINILGQQRAAVYATSTHFAVYTQVFPATAISYVMSPTNQPDIQQVVTYWITILKCENSKNPSSNCADDELLWFHISFGDGSELENFYYPDSLRASRFVHAYNTSGAKHVTTTVKNMAKYDAVSQTYTVKVLPSIEKVELYSVELDLVQPGQLAVITTIGLSGTHMQCTWVYGDESPPETLSLEQLPIPTTYHRYQEAGEFIVSVRCWNRLQSRTVQTLAVVHMLIHGLQSATDAVVEYGQPYLHTWRIIQGSHIDCLVFFGNKSLTEVTQDYFEDVQNFDEAMMYYNSDTKVGHARIPTQLYIQDPQNSDRCLLPGEATTYTLLVSCYNGVTDPSPSIATYVTFEVPVSGFTLTSEKQIAQVNEEICVNVNISSGSNIILSWNFGNPLHPEYDVVEYCGEDECRARQACLLYEHRGDYMISVQAFNSLGSKQRQISLGVQIPITQLELLITPAIVPNDVTVFLLRHPNPTPTGSVLVDFGDDSPIKQIDLVLNDKTGEMNFTHRYTQVKIYTVSIHTYNEVSRMNITQTIQIGLNIEGESLTLVSSSFARSAIDDVFFHCYITIGSEVSYEINFGDNSNILQLSENSTRRSPEHPDFHKIQHRYLNPGNYVVSMDVWNVFDRHHVVLDQMIIVQNPLHSGKYNLTEISVPPIAFPPGEVLFYGKLIHDGSQVPAPSNCWANNVYSLWKFPGTGGDEASQNFYGEHEMDIFPVSFTCSKENVGDNLVKVELKNLVSSLMLKYSFKVMEVVGNIQLTLSNLEDQPDVTVTDTTKVDVSLHHPFKLTVALDKGSHISYQIDFGDGSFSYLDSPVLFAVDLDAEFEHSYKQAGLYSINVKASNNVSESTKVFSDIVVVYQHVGPVTMNIQYIDFDEELNEVDVFEQSSEIYALVYGRQGFETRVPGSYFYQQSRPLKLHAGLYNGSKVNMVWEFVDEQFSVHFDYNENGYHSSYVVNGSGMVYVLTDNTVKLSGVHIKRLRKLTTAEVSYLGPAIASGNNKFNFLWESSLLVRFLKSGSSKVKCIASNPVSSSLKETDLKLVSVIKDLSFIDAEPPVANRTSNISFSVKQVGTDSCFLVDPGDSSRISSFGLTRDCLLDVRITEDNFFLITEDKSEFSGRNFSYYNISAGRLSEGIVTLNLTMQHVYTQPAFLTIKVQGFNSVTAVEVSIDIAVTKIICDFPTVAIEKLNENSLQNARRIFSFLEFRLFSSISIDCSLTRVTIITWQAFTIFAKTSTDIVTTEEVKEDTGEFVELPQSARKFASPNIKFKSVEGLRFTSKSEDITFKPRFFKMGPHLVCINVAMFQVPGVISSDCIFLDVILPPILAGITYGVRRAVSHGQMIEMDAGSASYDPSEESLSDAIDPNIITTSSNYTYSWSCPILLTKPLEDQKDEVEILFDGKPDWITLPVCLNTTLSCSNKHRVIEAGSAIFYNLTLISNDTTNITLTQTFKTLCHGLRSCDLIPQLWLNDLVSNDSLQLLNQTEETCLMVQYRCDVPADSTHFKFINSTSECLTSGYYGAINGQVNAECDALLLNNTCTKIQVNTSALRSNSEYIVRLKIKDKSGRSAKTFQVLELSGGEPPKIKITCLVNCNIKTNTRTALSLVVQLSDENSMVYTNNSIRYKWTLFIQTQQEGESEDLFEIVDNFNELSSTGSESVSLVLRPHSLLPGKKYHVRITGITADTAPGITEMELSTNLPPYGGSCSISPLEGTAINTTFNIICENWKDEGFNVDRSTYISPNDYTLVYQVFCQTDPTLPQTLLSYGNTASLLDRYLPPGLPQYDFKVWIQVRVFDEYGESAVTNMTVKVYEAELSNELLKNLTNAEILTSSTQKISQLSGSVSGVLNRQAANATNATQGSKDEQKSRTEIRSELMNAVVGRINKDSDLDGILQSCSAISSITEIANEVDDVTQVIAVDALNERSALLSQLSSSKSSEDITESASVVAVGLENVVMATRSQVIGDAEKTDPASSLVDLPLFSFNPAPSRSLKITLNEEEEYLSPEEREEMRANTESDRLKLYEKNKAQAKTVGSKATETIFSLSGSILKRKQSGEPPVTIQNKGLSLETQKTSAADLCKTSNNSGSSLSNILKSSKVGLLDCNSTDSAPDVTMETELLTMKDNPFVWDGSADNVRSSVVSLTFKYSNGSKVDTNSSIFRFEIPIDEKLSSVSAPVYSFSPSGDDQMSYHEMAINKIEDVTFINIQPLNVSMHNVKLRIYFLQTENLREFPNTTNFNFTRELPNFVDDPNHPYRLRFNGSDTYLGRYAFGIHEIDDNGNVTSPQNMTLQKYEIYNFVTSCRYWNETLQQWNTNGCDVSSESNSSIVVCYCNHLTSFGAGFLVAPNPIDFASLSSKLQNIKDNLSVLLTLICIFVLYVVGLFYCRRQDKKDIQKWCVALLPDNKLCDEYFYQITIKTGTQRNSETQSEVFFVLGGENGNTSVRRLSPNPGTKFPRGSVKKFLMAVDDSLGALSYVRVFHNNTGKGSYASWYLDHVSVCDMQTNKNSLFFCDDWLAVDESDGSIDRVLPVAGKQQISNFKHLFASSTRKDFSDGHLWFSLISRPTKSRFNRVQRLSSGLAVLLSTMLASAMFFGRDETDGGQQGRLEIGPISFTIQQLLISIQASFIVLPVNILIVQMFRRTRPKNPPKPEEEEKGSRFSLGSLLDVGEEINPIEQPEKKSGFTLPHWTIYFTWSLVFIVSAVSASFVFMYSIDWGAAKSVDWLTSIVLSFTQSVFIIQPAKVILTAIALSVFVNRCAKHRAEEMVEEEEDGKEEMDEDEWQRREEEWLFQLPPEIENITSKVHAVGKEQLREARLAREKHKIMLETIHEVIVYLLYLILLLMAANTAKDPMSFRFHDSLSDIFLRQGEPLFDEVRTPGDFWSWCNNSLIPGLHASDWYNGKRVTWLHSRYVSNRETFVTGPARIRQLRVKKGTCDMHDNITRVPRECISTYSIFSQEEAHFVEGWKNRSLDEDVNFLSPWSFQDSAKLNGHPYTGLLNIYDGGGYSVTLGNTAKKSRKILKQLKDHGWVDRPTSAIFVEFTVYNANVNLFASVVLLLEGSANGAFFPYPVISPIRLYEFIDGKGLLLVITYIIFVLVLLYKIFNILKSIKEIRWKYFHHFWNWIDFISALMSITASGIYGVRYIHSHIILDKITQDVDKETFVNFQYLILWNDIFRFLMSFILFFATIKFTRLLRFNRRIRLLSMTLSYAAKPVVLFSVMFSIYFLGFLFLANLWFEQTVYAYSNIPLAAGEMFSMLLNRFDFTQLQEADKLLGPLFFSAFTGVCTIALLNMFIVILDESIKRARAELERTKNEFEVVDYMKKQLVGYIHSVMPVFLERSKTEEEEDELVYIPHPEQILEKRIDQLTLHVSNIELEFYEDENKNVDVDDLEAELDDVEMDDVMLDLMSIKSY